MSRQVEVFVIVEGQTEEKFVKKVLAPFLHSKNIYLKPTVVSKPGQAGGDIRFERVKNDIIRHLKQRTDTYLTLMIDFYGIKGQWSGLEDARKQSSPASKADIFNQATQKAVQSLVDDKYRPSIRFIPYVAMHEFEALLFSRPEILAKHLGVDEAKIQTILDECGEAENINSSPLTAPSKRLEQLSGSFRKTATGITVAEEIGIEAMRTACPLFDAWLTSIEQLAG